MSTSPEISAPVAHNARVERAELVYRVSLYYTMALVVGWVFLSATGIDGGRMSRGAHRLRRGDRGTDVV